MNNKKHFSLVILFVMLILWKGCAFKTEKNTDNQSISLPDYGLCAHRGAMATHPENTIPGFLAAIDAGAHMIEFDVALTRDSQIVVIHDATVDRTTNGSGKVSDYSLADIKKLDAGSWKAPEFKGTTIPTLDETLAIMPLNIWLNIHLKDGGLLAELVTRALVKENRLHQAFLACTSVAAKKAREINPDVIICNMDRRDTNQKYAKETIEMNAGFIQFRGSGLDEIYQCIPELVNSGVKINYYGTDSIPLLMELMEKGVHFPMVNDIVNTMKSISGTLNPMPAIIAHRGASSIAPENTLSSALLAWQLKADAVEVDIFLSKDNRIMGIHDANTLRTSGEDYIVKDTHSSVLRGLEVGSFKDEKYRGEKIPFLEEIIETIPPGKELVIEIKCGSEVIHFLKDIITKYGPGKRFSFICFDLETIIDIKRQFPDYRCYWLCGNKKMLNQKIGEVARAGLEGVSLKHSIIDKEVMDMAGELELEVFTYTVNDAAEALRLIKLGVKGITTDRPLWLRETLEATVASNRFSKDGE
jgi:glycerophosphoryl diester phosphodiesterase